MPQSVGVMNAQCGTFPDQPLGTANNNRDIDAVWTVSLGSLVYAEYDDVGDPILGDDGQPLMEWEHDCGGTILTKVTNA